MRRVLASVVGLFALTAACADLSGLSGGSDAGPSSDAAPSADARHHLESGPGSGSGSSGPDSGVRSHDASGSATGTGTGTSHDAGHAEASVTDATSGADAGSCVIGGVTHAPGTPSPGANCQSCVPEVSTSDWSNDTDGTPCGTGGICVAGTCVSGCEIGSVYFDPASVNANDPCQTCQVAVSTQGWSNITDGTSCGNGQICGGGQCGTQCDIGGTVVASGAVDTANGCQLCQPGSSTMAWSFAADGTSCASGEVCKATVCTAGCYIDGAFYAPGPDPIDPCETCVPATSTTAWTLLANGTATTCPAGQLCDLGACAAGCYIGGAFYMAGALSPATSCQFCHPGASTKAWTNESNGTACGGAKECQNGACVIGSGSGSDAGSGEGTGTGT